MSDDQRRNDPPRRRDVGALGMTDEELAELKRTKKWPTRQVEAAEGPPGLTLTSLPSREYLRGFAAGYAAGLRSRGAKGKTAEDIPLILKLLKETGDNVEQARTRFIVERGRALLIDEPPRARLIVRQSVAHFTVRQTGRRVIDLTPQQRSVLSKRFTRAVKEIRKVASTD